MQYGIWHICFNLINRAIAASFGNPRELLYLRLSITQPVYLPLALASEGWLVVLSLIIITAPANLVMFPNRCLARVDTSAPK